MVIASHQPNFLPYMGVIYKIFKSDIFVLSDDVMFSKKGCHNWNKIYTTNGETKLTIPVNAHHDTMLCDVNISEPYESIKKINRSIKEAYSKAKHYDEGMEIVNLMAMYSACNKRNMVDLNILLLDHIIRKMGIVTSFVRATKELNLSGHKDERIIQMCEQLKADVYYSGIGAKAYHNEDEFNKRSINLVYSDYETLVYEQNRDEFIPNLSVLDYIFNCGYEIPKEWVR